MATQEQDHITGARSFVLALEDLGVEVVFGYPGAVALSLFDELYKSKKIKTVLARHEQGATHMAEGYARTSGKPGVVLVTSGPGATNTVTGIANAFMDSVPVIVFSAQVATSVLGTDAFQESDITGITLPITKHSYLIKEPGDFVPAIYEAFHIATSGRPGPVLIDVPVDISKATVDFKPVRKLNLPGYKPTVRGHARQISQAALAIKRFARPVLLVGGGIITSGANAELKELAEKMQIPVVTTLMGRGSFAEDHHLWVGMPGMHGAKYANYTLAHADLIIAVGVRFDDRITGKIEEFAKEAFIVHADIDPAEIGKLKAADVPLVGDAKDILSRINEVLDKEAASPKSELWLEQIDEWREMYPLSYDKDAAKTQLFPEYVVERIAHALQGQECIIATEVGQNQMWAAQYSRIKAPRTWISSGGLGAMGFGFPAALGAQIANPKARVVVIAGDGSFQMNMQELATAKEQNLPVKVVVLNNASLGMIRQWQELFYDERYACSVFDGETPNLVKIAEAYGIYGACVTDPSTLDATLKEAFECEGPALIDCRIVKDEMVFPMAKPGGSILEMLGGVGDTSMTSMIERKEAR